MTTKIADRYAQLDGAVISAGGAPDTVYVGVDKTSQPHNVDVLVDRAEFLAAVATELDVLIIPRTDLPEVNSTLARGLRAIHGPTGSEATIRPGDSADDVRGLALCYLAMAEHLEKNPPIDEAQVDALADLIIEADGTESVTQKLAIRHVARSLVAAGVRAPQAGDTK